MCTSSVFVDPNQFSSQTSAIRSSRVTTRPARPASATSRSNSFFDRSTLLAVERRAARRRVDLEGADPHRLHRLVAPLGAAQHRADARDHLGARERLDDVVVGAQLEADDLVGLGAARGDHHDRRVALAAQRAGHVAAVAVRQRQVEQHQVGVDPLGDLDRLGDGGRDDRLEPLARRAPSRTARRSTARPRRTGSRRAATAVALYPGRRKARCLERNPPACNHRSDRCADLEPLGITANDGHDLQPRASADARCPGTSQRRADQLEPSLPEHVLPDMTLLVSELVTNGVKYGGEGPVRLEHHERARRASARRSSTRASASPRSSATGTCRASAAGACTWSRS